VRSLSFRQFSLSAHLFGSAFGVLSWGCFGERSKELEPIRRLKAVSRRLGRSKNRTRVLRRARPQTGSNSHMSCFEDELGRRSAAKLLSKDEARRIASNYAKADLLRR
jgi:hypothetical protein